MNTVVVRCGGCRQLSRVAVEAVGLEVACPRCPVTFVALPEVEPDTDPPVVRRADTGRVPVVHPRPAPARPVVWELPPEPHAPVVEPIPPTGGLTALAMLPLGIPLLWLLASALAGREVVFSFAVPLALAVGLCGVGFGLAHVNRWSLGARMKALLALLLLGYLIAAFLFVVKKEWLEGLARGFNNGEFGWREFRAPETDTHIGYSVKFPGRPVTEAAAPVPDWKWLAHQHEEKGTTWPATYLSAVGPVPGEVAKPWQADAAWLDAVGAVVRKADGFALESETAVSSSQGYKGREFYFTGPDHHNRVVRLYAVRHQAVYLSVEGPFLTPDHPNVERFLRSLHIPFGKDK